MKTSLLLLCAALVLGGCNEPAPAEWEYQEVDWSGDAVAITIHIWNTTTKADENIPCKTAVALLDQLGKRHWELVTVIAGPGGASFFLKRPRPSTLESYGFDPQLKTINPAK